MAGVAVFSKEDFFRNEPACYTTYNELMNHLDRILEVDTAVLKNIREQVDSYADSHSSGKIGVALADLMDKGDYVACLKIIHQSTYKIQGISQDMRLNVASLINSSFVVIKEALDGFISDVNNTAYLTSSSNSMAMLNRNSEIVTEDLFLVFSKINGVREEFLQVFKYVEEQMFAMSSLDNKIKLLISMDRAEFSQADIGIDNLQ